MTKYRARLAFDGTAYAGWQRQSNALGIQQVIEEALERIDRAPVRIYGSSRTDAGVHARGFVIHFFLEHAIPAKNITRAVNAQLPEAIRFLSVARASEAFDARLSAKGKEYRYHVYQAAIEPPWLVPYWTFCHRTLSLEAMQKAASYFVGSHDFAPFAANPDRPLETTVRTVFSFEIRKKGPRYVFIVRGDGFLYKQVRSMVGFLLSVGRGHEKPEAVREILEAKAPRTARVETAPSRGLFLWKVFYNNQFHS